MVAADDGVDVLVSREHPEVVIRAITGHGPLLGWVVGDRGIESYSGMNASAIWLLMSCVKFRRRCAIASSTNHAK